jgi:tRNA(fMet)-specific endonuclease VapC
LDTNIVVALFGDDSGVVNAVAEAMEVFVPAIVIGELWHGALKSARRDDNLQRIRDLAATARVLTVDRTVSETYGDIKNRLRAKGRPIPENDIWIAAVACAHELELVTRDEHFDAVDDLRRRQW